MTTHVVSYSQLDATRQCRLKAHLQYQERWRPETVSAALSRGKLFHAVMEAHYSAKALTLDSIGVSQAVGPYDVLAAAEDNEETDLVRWMYVGYIERYEDDSQWEILAVEHRVEDWLRAPNGRRSAFKLKGFVDLLVKDHSAGGGLWIVDHKDEALDQQLVTPTGRVAMGDIMQGDYVVGADGKPTEVVSVFPQETWRVYLDDGAEVRCGPGHLWCVGREGMEAPRISTTQELQQQVSLGGRHVYLPIAASIQHTTKELLVDPYTLGAFIGDGSITQNADFCTSSTDWMHFKHRMKLPNGDWWGDPQGDERRSTAQTVHVCGSHLKRKLIALRLLGCKAQQKFVPEQYMTTDGHGRYELLRGLMDTDGCSSNGKSRFVTSSPQLCDAVVRLARSLGGTARENYTQATHSWSVWVWTPHCHYSLPRKVDLWKQHSTQQRLGRRVVGVEPDGFDETQCIQVEAKDGLYLTGADRGYVVTHNTCRELPKQKALDFDDQFGLYIWLLRKQGLDVRGCIYNACRTNRLKRDMTLDERFRREYTVRTDTELETMAAEALATFQNAYRGTKTDTLPPRSPDPDRCGWRCPFSEPCLMSRKGRDIHELLKEMDYVQSQVRH
jgi:hypothetical protein